MELEQLATGARIDVEHALDRRAKLRRETREAGKNILGRTWLPNELLEAERERFGSLCFERVNLAVSCRRSRSPFPIRPAPNNAKSETGISSSLYVLVLIVVDGASPRIWNPADEPELVPVCVPSTVGAPII